MLRFREVVTARVSLRSKLTAGIILFLVVTIVGLSLFNISSQERSMIVNIRARSLGLTKTFAANSAQALLFRDYALLEYFVHVICQEKDVQYAYVLDSDGKVLVSRDHRFEGNILKDRISKRAAAAEEPLIQEFREKDEDFYDVAAPVEIGDAKWGTVRIGVSLKSTASAIAQATRTIVTRAFIACAIGFLVAFLMARSTTKPISLLAEASRKIAAGDLSHRVAVTTRDEIGELARTFNQMTESLALSVRDLQNRVMERSLLYDLSSTISKSMSIKDISTKLLDTSVKVLEVDAGSFMVLDKNEGKLRIALSRGLSEELVEKLRWKIGEGIAGIVAKDAKPLVINDISKESPVESFQGSLKSCLSVPLITQGRVFGVLNVYTTEPRNFSKEDVEIVSLMVEQAAVAIGRERLVESLGEEKSKTESILHSMADGVLATNKEGEIILFNAAARKIFNLPKTDKLGMALTEVIKQRDVTDLMFRSLKEGKGLTGEIDLPGPEERIIHIQTSLIRSKGGILGVVAIIRDITEVRRLSQAKSDFLSMVSHELRTPLASIKAYTDTLIKKADSLDKRTLAEFFEIIRTESNRLTKLISQLLDTSTMEAGRFEIELEAVDLVSLIKTTIDEMSMLGANEHQFKLDFPDELSMIVGDPDRIRQVVTNLVENAVKYSPENDAIAISAHENQEEVIITVADNGIGIDSEHIDWVFQRFYRIDEDPTSDKWGTGLGLFIAKNIVEAHHGKIWVESEKNQGSTFSFTLPKHRKLMAKE